MIRKREQLSNNIKEKEQYYKSKYTTRDNTKEERL